MTLTHEWTVMTPWAQDWGLRLQPWQRGWRSWAAGWLLEKRLRGWEPPPSPAQCPELPPGRKALDLLPSPSPELKCALRRASALRWETGWAKERMLRWWSKVQWRWPEAVLVVAEPIVVPEGRKGSFKDCEVHKRKFFKAFLAYQWNWRWWEEKLGLQSL